MKKQLLAESAAKLYIEKLMTLENIAQRLNVNERNLYIATQNITN